MTDWLVKPEPLTVSRNAPPPGCAVIGLIDVSTGVGLVGVAVFTVNVALPDVPPPGLEVNTVTVRVPLLVMSAAAIDALSWVEDTNVVVRLLPFQRTVEAPLTKPVPNTFNVKAGVPAVALDGLKPVIDGTGFVGAEIV